MYRGHYQLVGVELSFFTRKLEAQLRFQNIPWQMQYKTLERSAEFESRSGTHFIPLLQTPDKWLLHDTIAIGPMLNQRFSERPVIPESPLQRACCFILEDAFNHWLGRACIHSRWAYPDNIAWVGPRFAANTVANRSINEPFSDAELEQYAEIGTMMYEGFGKNACEVLGVTADQSEAIKSDFKRMLEALAAHFKHHEFLLGPRPCLADFALAGASKAHFICDPEPQRWLGEHAEMLTDYTERFFAEWEGDPASWLADDQVPESLNTVFDYLQKTYYQSAKHNIAAGLAGDKYYTFDYGYGTTRARTQRRLNLARLHVQDELRRSAIDSDARAQTLLGSREILAHYLQ